MHTLLSKKKLIKYFFSRKEFLYGLLQSDFLYYLPLNKKSVVLDIGCGFGTHSFNASSFVGEVHGIDISEKKIEFCKARKRSAGFTNTHFILSDIKYLTFLPNTFDAIFVHEFSSYMDKRDGGLCRLYDLLKPGGVLYFGAESIFGHMFLKRKYIRTLRGAGFMKKPSFYIASPSYHLPRFLIPLQDTEALKFILSSMTAYRGMTGTLVRFFIKIPSFANIFKLFFHSYAIFVKK